MANYATLKSAIQSVIKTNGNNEITGAILQSTLISVVNSLGADYQFIGIATPSTNPGTPDQNVAYIGGAGTYPNFNNATIPDAHLGVLKYNGSWILETVQVGKNYDNEIAALQSRVSNVDYTAQMSEGQAINVGSYSVGDVVNTTPTSNPSISCILLPVLAGSTFKITGAGASGPRLWAILDSSKRLVSMAAAATTVSDYLLGVAQDGYVIFNVYTSQTHSIVSLVPFATRNELLELQTYVDTALNGIKQDGSFFDSPAQYCIKKSDGTIQIVPALTTVKCTTHFLPVKVGLKIFGCTGSNQTAFAFYDAGLNFISSHATATQGVNALFTLTNDVIPANAKYFRASGYPGCYIEGLTNNDLIVAAAEITRQRVSDIGFNPLALSFIDNRTILTNVNIGATVDVSTLATNDGYACSYTYVKAGDIIHFTGVGSGSYRTIALLNKNFQLVYKSGTEYFYGETLRVEQDGYLVINFNKSRVYSFYVECAEKFIMPFQRAKWVAMGDSITEGYYSDANGSAVDVQKCWAHLVSEINKYIFTNAGVGGQGYLDEANGANATDLVQTMDFSGYDLVTLAYGINDYKGSQPLGSMDDVVADKATVIACMRYVIESIIASNPLIKIIVITPLNCRGYEGSRIGDETTNYAIGQEINGKTLDDFFNAFVTVCQYYGIEYIDMTHASIINRKNAVTTLPDGVHPSIDAHLVLARELSKKINCY